MSKEFREEHEDCAYAAFGCWGYEGPSQRCKHAIYDEKGELAPCSEENCPVSGSADRETFVVVEYGKPVRYKIGEYRGIK